MSDNAIKIVSGPSSGPPFPIGHKKFIFPGGEVQVRLSSDWIIGDTTTITADIRDSDDVMELLMLTDAIRRENPSTKIGLCLAYLPYARQDRVCERGEALSLRVFTTLINAQNYEYVEVWDCHSDVGLALLNRVQHEAQSDLLGDVLRKYKDTTEYVLVGPDAGAMKKIRHAAKARNCAYIQADKIRSTDDGKILGTVIHGEVNPEAHYLIVDDICDGGATFIGLANELRKRGVVNVSLYVTHGIFSKGLDVLSPLFNKIYCANSWLASQDNLYVL